MSASTASPTSWSWVAFLDDRFDIAIPGERLVPENLVSINRMTRLVTGPDAGRQGARKVA